MKCGHNEDAKLLEVKKEGPNKGKKFYACARKQGDQCEFFEWVDKPAPRTHNGVQSQALTQVQVQLNRIEDNQKTIIGMLTTLGAVKAHTPSPSDKQLPF